MATGYNNWNDVIMAFYNEVRNAWPAPAADVTGQGHNIFSLVLADSLLQFQCTWIQLCHR